MKNIKYILAAIFAFAALSCQKEDPTKSNTEPGLVSVTLTTEPATKTHIHNNDVTKIYWNEGDKIKVFTDKTYVESISNLSTNASSFSMSEAPKNNFAKFSGNIAGKSTKLWAVYPESRATSCSTDGRNLKVSIPDSQNGTAWSFDNNLNISIASAEINGKNNGTQYLSYELTEPISLNFKNVCTLLKFTAPNNAEEISSVTITANEDIAGEMTIDFSGTDPIVKSISGSKSITMTGNFAANTDYYFVVAPVTLTGISMTIQTKASETKSAETFYIANKGEFKLQSGVARGLGKVNLNNMAKVSATAAHQSPEGILSGTNVTFNLGTADKVKDVNLTVNQINGSATRKATALTSTYSSDSAWPYLPQGDYSFTGSFSYNGVNVTIPATPFTEAVEAPTFTVNDFTAFTSYSKYVDNKSSVANTLDGSSIYKTVTVNIADNILNGSNYKSMIKVDGSSFDPKTIDGKVCVSFGGKSWTKHDVNNITWTFDNTPVTKTLTTTQIVHVTGIPERITLYGNEDEAKKSKWLFNNVKWEAGKCIIFYNGADGNMISPKFYVPQDKSIKINCSSGAQYYVGFINIAGLDVDEFSADIRVGLTSNESTVSNSYVTHSLTASKNPGESFYQNTDQFNLTSSCHISIHHSNPTQPKRKPLFITYSADYWYINLQKVYVEYL